MCRALASLALVAVLLSLVAGCSTGPHDGSGVAGSSGQARLLQMSMTLSDQGAFDSQHGYYAILFNALGEPIEPTQNDKFTDFLRWDGTNLYWFHRQANPQNPASFTYVATTQVNQALSFSSDQRTMRVILNIDDASSPLNQFISTSRFTVHAVSSDTSGYLGRILDTLGQGPQLNQALNSTVTVDKVRGVVSPVPPSYPTDSLNDWVFHPELAVNFPYVNFDIRSFEVSVR